MSAPQAPADDPRYAAAEELGDEIVRMYRLMRSITVAKMDPNSTISAQRSILANLAEPCRAKDLTRTLGLGESAVSRNIAQLEAEGLVQRTADPHDRRAQIVSLTEAGAAFIAERTRERTEHFLADLSHWDEDRFRLASEIFAELREMTGRMHAAHHPHAAQHPPSS